MRTPDAVDDVGRYVAGQLVGAELDAFETAMFEDAELLAAVEAEQVLRAGLRAQTPASVAVLTPARPSPLRRWSPGLALAASFLLGVGGVMLVRFEAPPSSVETNVPVLLLETSRAPTQAVRTFRVSPAAKRLMLQIPVVKPAEGATFDLHVRDAAGRELLLVDGLQADGDEMLTAVVPSSALPPGNYRAQIVLHGGGGGDALNVEFDVAN